MTLMGDLETGWGCFIDQLIKENASEIPMWEHTAEFHPMARH